MTVTLRLPSALAALVGGRWALPVEIEGSSATDLATVLDAVARAHPALERRLRDETGALRGFVNVYVDGVDVRPRRLLDARVGDGAVIDVVPSIAGG